MNESAVRSIKEVYLEGVKRKSPVKLHEKEQDIITLLLKKRGGLFLLGQKLDALVQTYLRKVREGEAQSQQEL